ncbi:MULTISPECIES: TetR family transcriptional regulator [unclassified Xanthobacter]|uniref:TetR family transcriptional regulator n=1 Tax=unclassified Xanthobacter TaxID=2623496 RepID=UPI002358C5EB|nr:MULTISPECIES: TetR family transcriptional regulator [unclassified Xanthobacter]
MRRTKEQAAETGRQILKAAEALFLDAGYDNVRLEEIAVAAGVTRGAVHWHFKNKQGLLLALREEAQAPFCELADLVGHENGPALLSHFDKALCEMFSALEGDPRRKGLIRVLMRLDLGLSDQDDNGGTTFREEMRSALERIFQVVERDVGLRPPWTPQTAAAALGVTISGMVLEWALGKDSVRLVPDGLQLIRTMLDMWMKTPGDTADIAVPVEG